MIKLKTEGRTIIMAKVRKPVAEVVEKQIRRTVEAVEDWEKGVRRVDVAPTHLAAKAVDKQVAGVVAAAKSGKTQRNLEAIDLPTWQNLTINKGKHRIATGVEESMPKLVKFHTQFGEHLDRGLAKINQMPDGTRQQRIAKAVAMMEHNATFDYQK